MFHCPSCKSSNNVKNGHIHNGKQSRLCKDCRRQFVEDPDEIFVSAEKWEIVDRLLLEKLSLAGICRALPCKSPKAGCMTTLNANMPRFPIRGRHSPQKGRLRVQMDEMWSAVLSSVVELVNSLTTEAFVGSKLQKVWIWLAQDEDTREIVGWPDRSAKTAQELWDSLPAIYRQCAFIHTDFWGAYAFCPPNATKLSAKKPAKPAILSASITRFVSGFLAWSARPCPSRKILNTTKLPSGISSTITMPPSGSGYHDFQRTTKRDTESSIIKAGKSVKFNKLLQLINQINLNPSAISLGYWRNDEPVFVYFNANGEAVVRNSSTGILVSVLAQATQQWADRVNIQVAAWLKK